MSMRIGLAQINPVVGDFSGNCELMLRYVQKAEEEGCALLVFPEMALLGYPPQDLLDREDFVGGSLHYWQRIAEASHRVAILCGVVAPNDSGSGKPFLNAAIFCTEGRVKRIMAKRLLPCYHLFDEKRYFQPGAEPCWVDFRGVRLGVTICEDLWSREPSSLGQDHSCDPVGELAEFSPDLILNLSAFPYYAGNMEEVLDLLALHCRKNKTALAYVNQVGGNDELVFQGGSTVLDRRGQVMARGADFVEDLLLWDMQATNATIGRTRQSEEKEILQALQLGLRDYVSKCGFRRVVLGLSGGLDSAVATCVAALALGPENVRTVALPGPYSDPASLQLSRELAQNMDVELNILSIEELYSLSSSCLSHLFHNRERDVTEENIQARLRGLLLMAVSNKFGELLLNTGNKSELAVGYCTLYGDTNGGISVLGDVPKTMVYRLAELINEELGWIPEGILSRPPSAELSPGQKDEDTLPPYRVLDEILHAYLEENLSLKDIVAKGVEARTAEWVVRRVLAQEYKRRQGPPILRVTSRDLGRGRRLPVAHGYREAL